MNSTMNMSTDTTNSTSMTSTSMMQMSFTTSWVGVPVLFEHLRPTTQVYIFGVWMAIFFAAIIYRGLSFLRSHLEATCWSPQHCGDEMQKESLRNAQPFSMARDGGRALLALVSAMFGYALMLVVMSFVVAYFFAVVTGLAVGELIFGRLYVRVGRAGELEHH